MFAWQASNLKEELQVNYVWLLHKRICESLTTGTQRMCKQASFVFDIYKINMLNQNLFQTYNLRHNLRTDGLTSQSSCKPEFAFCPWFGNGTAPVA